MMKTTQSGSSTVAAAGSVHPCTSLATFARRWAMPISCLFRSRDVVSEPGGASAGAGGSGALHCTPPTPRATLVKTERNPLQGLYLSVAPTLATLARAGAMLPDRGV